MKKTLSILLFLSLILLGCTGKTHVDEEESLLIDSLPTFLSLANDVDLTYDLKQKYNKKAFAIIIKQKDDSVNKVNLFKIANRYYNMSDWKSYLQTTELILKRSKETKDSANIAKAYTYLGDYYVSKSVSDSAFMNFYHAEKLYLASNDYYNLAKTRLSKALLQYNEGDFFSYK